VHNVTRGTLGKQKTYGDVGRTYGGVGRSSRVNHPS